MMRSQDLFVFPESEITGRVAACQAKLADAGMAGMVVSAESNLNYYCNFSTHAPWTTYTRPSFLFIPAKGTPVLYTQVFLTPEARAITAGCECRNFDSLLGPTAQELAALMGELGMATGKIGFELGFEQRMGFQIDTFLGLKDCLPEAEFVDAADLVWSQRIIKSANEIECHRRACQATSYVHDHVFPQIRKGMSEIEISRMTQQLMLEGGAEYPGFVIITSGKGNYERISKTATNRCLADGDILWLDLGARYRGYWSDFCRAGVVGGPDPVRAGLQDKIHEVTMRAAESIRPGTPVAEVARACGRELERMGFDATFECGRMGHGMGLMSTEPPSVTIYDDTVLQEGMIINLEPGLVDDRGVFDIEENFVVTKDGCECLSGGSRKLHVIE